ncbi:S9 family peptidase [Pleionea mediterranea]|uniref:Dipeptidyl aminopeptidase/acylaminoacyl peptidase n=1 Tax=Pleionea mediterranea TaxID=523701 RepID=A0A316FVG0_9GAMM|nr:S9 family peptidase [Pleionea mediterranea]PWK45391.1 dipeptidyl aminopeptidase/acylaminoacyl peptidase [Pleionea mediterranea]
MITQIKSGVILLTSLLMYSVSQANDLNRLQLDDVFTLEYASGLEISNNAEQIYFVRNYMDRHTDRKVGNIWRVDRNKQLTPVTNGLFADYAPTLSPDEKKLAYLSTASGKSQIHIKWLDTGQSAQMTHFSHSPQNISWSPDGQYIAFTRFVPGKNESPVSLPGKPKGAKWAKPAVYIDDVYYRFDGAGYTKSGNTHVFIMSADGGTARQITNGEFDHSGALSWAKDGSKLYFSANRHKDKDLDPTNTEIFSVDINSKKLTQLTDRNGPDSSPKVSPDGKLIAYLGYDQQYTNYENTNITIMSVDGSNKRTPTSDFDRSASSIQWSSNSKGLYLSYDDKGSTYVAYQPLNGKRKVVAKNIGGQSFGRPYSGGEFDVASDGTIAFTISDPQRPADVAMVKNNRYKTLTQLNEDALGHKDIATIEELWLKSSYDQRDIQAWIAYPPGFDRNKKYPLILEIHGGPVTNYGPHFSTEVQLMAAKGYVVVYANPRGSDSYGKEFAQTIHHNYPSQDYDDLMSTVDAVIDKGFINEKELFVTGGSGGGVLTAWIVGHTDRFAAAVVAKPVINWYSFVLTSDFYPFFYKNWFGKKPWEDVEHYMKRSPISYVGNVKTPTMLLTGEADYRTPISETEQFYQALKLQQVETAMVRIPDAPHGIYKRPSNLMSKVAYILHWFEKYRDNKDDKN